MSLWHVTATVDVELVVSADTEAEAHKIAKARWLDEWRNTYDEPDTCARELDPKKAPRLAPDLLDCLPWSKSDDESEQRTVREILEAGAKVQP